MQRLTKYLSIIVILSITINGCEKFSDRFLEPIESTGNATVIMEAISVGVFDSRLLDELEGTLYADTVINGISGSARVTGEKVFQDEVSCGEDCIESSTTIDITVVFYDYKVLINNGRETTLSGTVKYFESETTTLDQDFYITSGYVKIEGDDVDITLLEDEKSGTRDNISFRVTGESPRLLSGWCIPENGVRYQF